MWMIYGTNGYTGRLAARYAKGRGLSPVVAGRHGERIRPLADELGFESRVFDLGDEAVAAKNLEGITAVLHCAGPFWDSRSQGVFGEPETRDLWGYEPIGSTDSINVSGLPAYSASPSFYLAVKGVVGYYPSREIRLRGGLL
jgi:uncharacterized protein YbjT (DUF2867 family)